MSLFTPIPTESHISEVREAVPDVTCPRCESTDVKRYRAVTFRGWERLDKCQSCLWVLESELLPMWGNWKPYTADWDRTAAG